MAGPSVPLSMLVARNVPYEWHDAIAIVAQFVQQLLADVASSQKRIPDSSGIALEQNGSLTIKLDPDSAMPVMPGAVQLLQQLLAGREQPTGLRLALLKLAGEQPTPALEAFAAELSRWERPNRQAKLVARYQHAAAQLGFAPAVQPAASIAVTPTPTPTPTATSGAVVAAAAVNTAAPAPAARKQSQAASLTRRELVVLGAVGVAVIVAAIWIATGQPIPLIGGHAPAVTQVRTETPPPAESTPSQPPIVVEEPAPTSASAAASESAPTPQPEDLEAKPVSRAAARQPQQVTPEPARSADSARTMANATNRPPLSANAANRPATATVNAAPPPRENARVIVPEVRTTDPSRQPSSQPALTSRAPARTTQPTPRVPDEPVASTGTVTGSGPAMAGDVGASSLEYRSGDAGVTPPVPLARLPRKPDPDTPANQLQVLEVHVNSDGTVESARFVNNPPSYRNRWWASAAKSWRFRPALKDGRPVKYVLRLVIQDPGGA